MKDTTISELHWECKLQQSYYTLKVIRTQIRIKIQSYQITSLISLPYFSKGQGQSHPPF